jgi:hypothetical protein
LTKIAALNGGPVRGTNCEFVGEDVLGFGYSPPLGHEPLAYNLGGRLPDQGFLVRMVGQAQSEASVDLGYPRWVGIGEHADHFPEHTRDLHQLISVQRPH